MCVLHLLQLIPDTLSSLRSSIDRLGVCAGQPDTHYVQIISAKHGVVKSCNGDISATLNDYASVTSNGEVFKQTVQTAKYELLVIGNGNSCKAYRATLRKAYNRWSIEITDTSSHTNI